MIFKSKYHDNDTVNGKQRQAADVRCDNKHI